MAQDPKDAELIGNLALAYLFDGRLEEARKTAAAAIKLEPNDAVNQSVSQIVQEVESGKRPQPNQLSDLN